ncbi:hypothetical protein CC78DRAFT_596760 [Lojkania enalia]|uniref:Uncharacterized protein n=1 Tax=Lojkania enalia TaxID=147567 RepID=A0A9P4N7H5_9PLEO|nr:hypothetical protein CC78DRAFT_596760 [Didymosphaeria enalia]
MAFPAPQTPIRSVRRRTSRAEPIANEITSTILTVLATTERETGIGAHTPPLEWIETETYPRTLAGPFVDLLHLYLLFSHGDTLGPEISDSGSNYTTANESASLSEDSCNERTVAHGSPESGLDMSTPKPRKPHRRISSARLIKFKASAVNDQDGRTTGEQPRRKVSLGLPINISNNEPPGLLPAFEEDTFSEQQERELEYEHRHTFIGTASVDDFLNVLETTGINTTSMARVAKAFTELAAREQLFARQHSSDPEGWELVSRITLDVADNWEDCIVQARVKLGSVTLGQFLELVPLDEKKVVSVVRVVEAFCVASRIDAEVGNGAGSKARAFRSCMVRRKSREGLSILLLRAREDGETQDDGV